MAVVAEDGVDISDTNLGGHSAPGILHHQDLQIRGTYFVLKSVEQEWTYAKTQMKYTSISGKGGDN